MTQALSVDAQFPPKLHVLFQPSRYKVLYGGRGGAKSWGVARALLLLGVQNPIRVLCARELQNSIDDSVHQLLSDQVYELGLERFYDIQAKTIIGINGTTFNYEGLRQNTRKIKSYEGVNYVWVEEADAVSKNSWDILIPTIRRDGSEIWITFNPEFEDDETYERFVLSPPDNAVVVELNYRDNPWFPSVLEEERLYCKRKYPDDYDHIWEGQCRKWLDGAIYATELKEAYAEERIRKVGWDENIPVFTAWDIGRTDDTAIWWYQVAGREIHVLESYGLSGGSPAHFVSQVLGRKVDIDIVQGRVEVYYGPLNPELEHRQKYRYEAHWIPHDAKAKTFSAHGKSTQQQLQAALEHAHKENDDQALVRVVPGLSIEDGIKVARTTFPRCYFDQDRCSQGMKALRAYRREVQRDEVSLHKKPKHDWSSHFADAFRYLSIAWDEPRINSVEHKPVPDSYGFDDEGEENWKTA